MIDRGPTPVLIDTDPGIDDALALMLAFASPEIEVVQITTVAGNGRIREMTANARALVGLYACGPAPPVTRGSATPLVRRLVTATHVHGDDGLGGATELARRDGRVLLDTRAVALDGRDAAGAIIDRARRHAGELVIVALGPLTNIARAIERDPVTMRAVRRMVVMGGSIAAGGNMTAAAEFNFFVDPDAAHRVMTSGLPITLVPLDVTQRVRLDAAMVRTGLARRRDDQARVIRRLARDLLGRHGSFALHDPLAVAVAIAPALVSTQSMPVSVEKTGRDSLGASIADRRARPMAGPRVDVALEVDVTAALALFSRRVLRPSSPSDDNGVLVVGSANINLTVAVRRQPDEGETVTDGVFHRGFGGKGANQAVAARRAGARVGLVAKLGADPDGEQYAARLRDEGIEWFGGALQRGAATGVALITVDRHGENRIAVAAGANRELSRVDLERPAVSEFDYRVMVAQFEVPMDVVVAALREARRRGAMTVLNPAPMRPMTARVRRLADVVVVNRVEAAQLSGIPVRSVRDAQLSARRLRASGFGAAVITLGAGGAVWSSAQGAGRERARRVEVLDTVGAGDTFVGYLAAALGEAGSLADAVGLAVRASAAAVTRRGAQAGIPLRRDVPGC